MPAIHPKKERQRIWRDKGDRRRVHARSAGSLCRFAKNRVYRRNLCCIPRAAKTAAVKEIDAAPMSALGQKRTYAAQQKAAYSITSSAVASSEGGTVRP